MGDSREFDTHAAYNRSSIHEKDDDIGGLGMDHSSIFDNNMQESAELFDFDPYSFEFDKPEDGIAAQSTPTVTEPPIVPPVDEPMPMILSESFQAMQRRINDVIDDVSHCGKGEYFNGKYFPTENKTVLESRKSPPPNGNPVGNQTENGDSSQVIGNNATKTIPASKPLVKPTMKLMSSKHPPIRRVPYTIKPINPSRPDVLFPVKVVPTSAMPPYQHQRFRPSGRQLNPTRVANENRFNNARKISPPTTHTTQNATNGNPMPVVQEPIAAEAAKVKPHKRSMTDFVPRDKASNHVKCSMCKSAFSTKLALHFHEVERHTCVYAFQCNNCPEFFTNLAKASAHLTSKHNEPIIPLYDKNIIGHGVEVQTDRSSPRRVSGMICSFLNKHMDELGILTGLSEEDKLLVKQNAKRLFCGGPQEFIALPANFDLNLDQERSATLNHMLNKEFIYGPSITRVPITTVDLTKIDGGNQKDMKALNAQQAKNLPQPPRLLPPKSVFVRPPQPRLPLGAQQQPRQQVPRLIQRPATMTNYNLPASRVLHNYPPGSKIAQKPLGFTPLTANERLLYNFSTDLKASTDRNKLVVKRVIKRVPTVNNSTAPPAQSSK